MPNVNISTIILAIFVLNALKRSITLGTKPPFLPLGMVTSSIIPNGVEMLLERLPFLQTLLLIYFSIRRISHNNLIASEFTHDLGQYLMFLL